MPLIFFLDVPNQVCFIHELLCCLFAAPYSNPIISSVKEDNRIISLSCHANGGYPKGTIDWFDEKHNPLTSSHEQEAIQTEDGLFNLTSTLNQPPDTWFYICAVIGTGGQEGEARFDRINDPEKLQRVPEGMVLSESLTTLQHVYPETRFSFPIALIGVLSCISCRVEWFPEFKLDTLHSLFPFMITCWQQVGDSAGWSCWQ